MLVLLITSLSIVLHSNIWFKNCLQQLIPVAHLIETYLWSSRSLTYSIYLSHSIHLYINLSLYNTGMMYDVNRVAKIFFKKILMNNTIYSKSINLLYIFLKKEATYCDFCNFSSLQMRPTSTLHQKEKKYTNL